MMQRGNASMMVGASSWKDQFLDAFTVQAGDDEEEGEEGGEEGMKFSLFFVTKTNFFSSKFPGEEGEGEEKMPTCSDYIMHFLTLFWKVLFALVPPAGEYLICKY